MKTALVITPEIEKEIKLKWKSLKIDHLLEHLIENFNYQGGKTTIRNYLYSNKMFKTNMIRWSPKETKYLLQNYGSMGNIEVANNLSSGKRIITKKNVEKKMKLMGLKRTSEQLKFIREKHIDNGVYRRGSLKKMGRKKNSRR